MGTTPVFVTETDEPTWTDCTWASALMLANEATRGKYPATRAEREALRLASGDLAGGSNLNDVDRGTQARYGFRFRRGPTSWSAFTVELAPESGALLQGIYARLPAHYRRWDPSFTGAHAVYIERMDSGELWWMDPLGRGAYRGEVIPDAAAKAFALGLGTVHASIAREGEFGGDEMFPVVDATLLVGGPRLWHVATGVTISGYDPARPGQVIKTVTFAAPSSAHADATVYVEWQEVPPGQSAPVPKGGPFLRVTDGLFAGLLIVAALVTLDPEPTAPTETWNVTGQNIAISKVA